MTNIFNSIFLLIITTLICYLSDAQEQIIFEESKGESFLVQYTSGQTNHYKNTILTEIAQNIPKPVQNTRFSYSFLQKCRIIKGSGRTGFQVEFDDIQYSGDINYKGFPVGDALFPCRLSFDLEWQNTEGQVIHVFNFDKIIVPDEVISVADFYEDDSTDNTGYLLKVKNKNFTYNENNKYAFDSRKVLINDYYDADVQVAMAFRDLEAIDPDNLDMLHKYKEILDHTVRKITAILNKDLYNKLCLYENDPVNLDMKIKDLQQFMAGKRQAVESALMNLHLIYYNKGLEQLSFGKMEAAKMFFSKSLNCNIYFAPSHYQLASIEYKQGNPDGAVEIIKSILSDLTPDPQTVSMAVELAGVVFDDYIAKASEYNDRESYERAQGILDKATDICQGITGVHCSESLTREYTRAITGKYNMYLSKADEAISDFDFDLAHSQINTAMIFRKNHTDYIPDDEGIKKLTKKLYNACIAYGNKMHNTGAYEKALDSYLRAADICHYDPEIQCSDELGRKIFSARTGIYDMMLQDARKAFENDEPDRSEEIVNRAVKYQQEHGLKVNDLAEKIINKINYKRYRSFIDEGKKLAGSGMHASALDIFGKAKDLENYYIFATDDKLDSYISGSAVKLVVQLVNEGEKQTALNDLSRARQYYSEARNIRDNYNLQDHGKVSEVLQGLKDRIFSQECRNARDDHSVKLNTAQKLIENKKYLEAELELDKALQIISDNSECDISAAEADEKKRDILPAAAYQKMFIRIEGNIRNGYYEEALKKYHELEDHYHDLDVQSFGIEHIPLNDFVKKCKSDFVNYSAQHFTSEKQYDPALDMLKELEKRQFRSSWTKVTQTRLGSELAVRDHNINPQGVAKHLVLKYTGGEKYFKYLKKAYMKQWKKL